MARSGKIIDYAVRQPCVRGVTFQPVQAAGRLQGFNPATDRLTLTEVRRKILGQCSIFKPEDIIPVPCHPDSLAMSYALKLNGKVVPLTGLIDPKVLIEGGRNTIVYEQDESVRDGIFASFCHKSLSTVQRRKAARSALLPAPSFCAGRTRIQRRFSRSDHAVY